MRRGVVWLLARRDFCCYLQRLPGRNAAAVSFWQHARFLHVVPCRNLRSDERDARLRAVSGWFCMPGERHNTANALRARDRKSGRWRIQRFRVRALLPRLVQRRRRIRDVHAVSGRILWRRARVNQLRRCMLGVPSWPISGCAWQRRLQVLSARPRQLQNCSAFLRRLLALLSGHVQPRHRSEHVFGLLSGDFLGRLRVRLQRNVPMGCK